jgi:DNA-binding transcriptional ArsR family regulator
MATKSKSAKSSAGEKSSRGKAAKTISTDAAAGVAQQLAEIAARLVRVEKAMEERRANVSTSVASNTENNAVSVDANRYWLISAVQQQNLKGGAVVFGGDVITPTGENYIWQQQREAKEMFKRDWTALDRVIAALGHPVRLRLLQAIIHGKTTKLELEHLDGLGTTGQLYHHLKILEEAGWVRSLERGVYGVPGERMVPLLTMLSASVG